MKNKNTYWIIGGIVLVVIIIAVVYAVTRKRPVPTVTAPVNPNPGGIGGIVNTIGGLIGNFTNLGGGSGNGSEVDNAQQYQG